MRTYKQRCARRYFTAGMGLRYQVFGVDFAYMLPRGTNHPLAQTLRITSAL